MTADRIRELLSPREHEVFMLAAVHGLKRAEIAKAIFRTAKCVDSHRSQILRKLGITSTAQMVALAHKAGLLEPAGAAA